MHMRGVGTPCGRWTRHHTVRVRLSAVSGPGRRNRSIGKVRLLHFDNITRLFPLPPFRTTSHKEWPGHAAWLASALLKSKTSHLELQELYVRRAPEVHQLNPAEVIVDTVEEVEAPRPPKIPKNKGHPFPPQTAAQLLQIKPQASNFGLRAPPNLPPYQASGSSPNRSNQPQETQIA